MSATNKSHIVVEATTYEIFLRSVEVQLDVFYIRINSGGDESSNHTDRLFLANVDDSRKLEIIT